MIEAVLGTLGTAGTIAVGLGTLTLIVIAHELGHFAAARMLGIRVLEFAVGFPPHLLRRNLAGTTFTLNVFPIGGYLRMLGENAENFGAAPDSFAAQPVWGRLLVLAAGPLANVLAGFGFLLVAALLFAPVGTRVTAVDEGSPAARAGIQADDRILALGEHNDILPAEFSSVVADHAGDRLQLLLERSGLEFEAEVSPRASPPAGQGPLGLRINYVRGPDLSWRAFGRALTQTGEAITLLPRYTAGALAGEGQINLTGVVGILDTFGQATLLGPALVLGLAGSISIQVALFNLLPWPVLDGGRMALILLEVVRGRRISPDAEKALQVVSMAALLILVVVVTAADISRIAGGGP
jgi:regulator of sigma E protease